MKYLRKKGRWKNGETKYIVEENNRYIRTVPPAEELVRILQLDGMQSKPSQKEAVKEEKSSQGFAHELLTEHPKGAKNETV